MNTAIDPVAAEYQLAILAEEWIEAKAAEETAMEKRRRIESEMEEWMHLEAGTNRRETMTHQIEATVRVSQKWDEQALGSILTAHPDLPEAMKPVRTKREVDARKLSILDKDEPALAEMFRAAVIESVGKPTWKVTKRE